ncbi:MAG TPA: DUF4390 domain-containing protein [Rudaea sp.]|nr:DUF4390 domain-containing protein [Rudaea sp.]
MALAAAAAIVAACARPAATALSVRGAALGGGVLSARLEWQPDSSVLGALDHGIPLDFVVRVKAEGASVLGWRPTLAAVERRIELRYYPLSRQYQWRDLDRGETRSYSARTLLIAALEDLRLPMDIAAPGAQRYTIEIDLDRNALPGALRIPALLRSAWRISSGTFAWPAPAA